MAIGGGSYGGGYGDSGGYGGGGYGARRDDMRQLDRDARARSGGYDSLRTAPLECRRAEHRGGMRGGGMRGGGGGRRR